MPPIPKRKPTMISLDTETNGLDLRHGAKPFLVTSCDEDGNNSFWEWRVDPLTREPIVLEEDLDEIADLLSPNSTGALVLQNPKFDVQGLARLRPEFGEYWRWTDTFDTLLAGHLLASNQPHDLTTMAIIYLGVNIEPYEDAVKLACTEARRIARSKYLDWRIAKKGLPEMPSAKESVAKLDMWLPKEIAIAEDYPDDHPWYRVTAEYANADSSVTLPLFNAQRAELERRGLWEIYLERLKILPVVYKMEDRGVTISKTRLEELRTEFREESARAGRVCRSIAHSLGVELELPKSGNNGSLTSFVFGELGLPTIKASKNTGKPSLDKLTLETYEATLPANSKQLTFVKALKGKRKRDTADAYLDGYERFWLPDFESQRKTALEKLEANRAIGINSVVSIQPEWFILHCSFNPTGTDTLRWASSNPNAQNIGKQKEDCPNCLGVGCVQCDGTGEVSFNLRYAFGPAPGREWWSLDYQNIELRIPAYVSGEQAMIEIFEKPDDPPYFGSYHLMNASIIYPDLFWPLADQKGAFKKKYASTWYQYAKNFGFAVSYGAMEQSGTADRAAHKKGAQRAVMNKLKEHTKLNQRMIAHAEKHGYVETLPDKEVCPERGYPLLCSRSKWGGIMPTVPLNYMVQGTACWVMTRGMVKVQAYLDGINAELPSPDYFIVMNVHDEMVLDFPAKANRGNLPIVREVQGIMERMGDCIDVPLTVGVEYHEHTWAKGETS